MPRTTASCGTRIQMDKSVGRFPVKVTRVPQVAMAWSSVIREGHSTDNYEAAKSCKVVGVLVNDRTVESYKVWEYHKGYGI